MTRRTYRSCRMEPVGASIKRALRRIEAEAQRRREAQQHHHNPRQ